MRGLAVAVFLLAAGLTTDNVRAQSNIVKDGQAIAGIVIAENPSRMVAMAALELQYYLEQVSDARLPIDHLPPDGMPFNIFIGRSRFTDSLGITDEGLKYGAFRMVSGKDWLVLLGHDFDFNPDTYEPWARSYNDRARAEMEWDELTMEKAGRKWGHPFNSLYKAWWNPREYDDFMAGRYGPDNRNIWNPRNLEFSREYQGPGAGAGFWYADEGGSLNAVYEFLRTLGVHYYMPGKLGEVIPGRKTIPVPHVDTTVRPDFAVRSYHWYNHYNFSFEDIIWARRTGINSGSELLGRSGGGYTRYAHGLTLVKSSPEMKAAHPEYYALIDGKRDTAHLEAGRSCFSSAGLVRETVDYVRFLYDHFDQPHVSIWPEDGYKHCQCDSCRNQSPSDLVFGFVDLVARELYKSHPDRLVSCGAYTPYKLPPADIHKFTPNVVVFISNWSRPTLDDPGKWEDYKECVTGWEEKLAPGHIMRVENNRWSIKNGTDKPITYPVIHPHAMARDLKLLKGLSLGEVSEESQAHSQWYAPGVDHLHLYVQARFFWNTGQDIDTLLEEYYTLFYGPAREEMKAALEFAEAGYNRTDQSLPGGKCDPTNVDLETRIQLLEMLHAARDTAGETVYGQRVQKIIDELTPLEELLPLVRNKATVTVIDRATGDPVYRATIRYGEDARVTDYSGRTLIDGLTPGKLVYAVDHAAYFPLTDSLMVTGDTSLVINLTRKLADIQFEVGDSSGPAAGATVSLNGWEIKTGSDGRTWFTNQPARRHYGYTVKMDGYLSVSDSLFLDIDTTVMVLLQQAAGMELNRSANIRIFPNPVKEKLYIDLQAESAALLLLNQEGKVLFRKRMYRGVNTIDAGGIPPGFYFLSIRTDEHILFRKVVLH